MSRYSINKLFSVLIPLSLLLAVGVVVFSVASPEKAKATGYCQTPNPVTDTTATTFVQVTYNGVTTNNGVNVHNGGTPGYNSSGITTQYLSDAHISMIGTASPEAAGGTVRGVVTSGGVTVFDQTATASGGPASGNFTFDISAMTSTVVVQVISTACSNVSIATTTITIMPPNAFTFTCGVDQTVSPGQVAYYPLSASNIGTIYQTAVINVTLGSSPTGPAMTQTPVPLTQANSHTNLAYIPTTALTPNQLYTLTFTAASQNPGLLQTQTCQAHLTVSAPPAPTVTITCGSGQSGCSLAYNGSTTITWSSTNATSCTVSPSGWTGTSGTNSTGALTVTTTYTANCTGTGGNASGSVTVTIGAAPDFGLTCTPPSTTIVAGSTTSYSLATTAINGFNSSITFSDDLQASDGAPTISYTNNGAKPPATTTAVILTDASTSPATYTITFSGTGGAKTHTCVVSLTITAPPTPDFSVSCTPSSSTITVGSNTSYDLATTPINSFNSTVTFSASFKPFIGTLPTISYTNNGAKPAATTTAVISTTASTTPATYLITFTGTPGSGSPHSCDVELVVNQSVTASPPTAVTARNTGVCGTVDITWQKGKSGATPEFFRVYHRISEKDPWTQLGKDIPYSGISSTVYSYTDSSPAESSNYYAVSAIANGIESSLVGADISPIAPQPCDPNLSTSDNDMIQVNGLTSSGKPAQPCSGASEIFVSPNGSLFRANDVATFQVNVCNTGAATLTNVVISDVLSNLSNPSNIQYSSKCQKGSEMDVDKDGSLSFALNDIDPGNICSVTFSATVTTPPGPVSPLYRFQNTATINTDQSNLTVYTPPYLFQIGFGIPSRNE